SACLTVMVSAPCTTWALVSTRPSAEMITPEPAPTFTTLPPEACPSSMATTEGPTLERMARTSSAPPGNVADGPPVAGAPAATVAGGVELGVVWSGSWRVARATPPATRAPTTPPAMAARAVPRERLGGVGGAGGAGGGSGADDGEMGCAAPEDVDSKSP